MQLSQSNDTKTMIYALLGPSPVEAQPLRVKQQNAKNELEKRWLSMPSRSSLHCSFSIYTSHISCSNDQDSCNESNYCVKDVIVNTYGSGLFQQRCYSNYYA
jgi:hypothetical protein